MEKEIIKKLAISVATLIGDTSQRVISSGVNELKVLKNIQINGTAMAFLYIESLIFGHYYIGEKFKGYMDENEQKIFAKELNESIVFILALMLNYENEEKDPIAHRTTVKKLYENFAPEKHKALSNYKGNTIIDLFKLGLRQGFNENDYKVKFFENTFKNRGKLNFAIAFSMNNPNNKFKDDVFLNDKTLYTMVDALFTEFSSMDYEQLSQEAKELI